jgi:hypothetical protein
MRKVLYPKVMCAPLPFEALACHGALKLFEPLFTLNHGLDADTGIVMSDSSTLIMISVANSFLVELNIVFVMFVTPFRYF